MKTISNSGVFTNFYDNNRIYIDKTETIYKLLMTQDKVFISRPRRFGKTLTLKTIGTLFEKGVDPYFKDTWIYDKWTESTYPVLYLDFLKCSVSDIDDFKEDLVELISVFANTYNIEGYKESSEPQRALNRLLTLLELKNYKVVVLIDEYDRQLVANINNPELYEKFCEIIRSIYATLKSCDSIKFLAVTGVTRLKDATIFSVGSDIVDISNKSAYSQLIGFTRDEIKTFYIDYLKLAASYDNNVSVDCITETQIDAILDKIAYNYDGYCFDENCVKKVFSSWSVNNFFKDIESNGYIQFGDYWYDNGGLPSIIGKSIEKQEIIPFEYLNKDHLIEVSRNSFLNPTSLLDIDNNVLLCQTGYLTLRSPLSSGDSIISLGFPNREVYDSLTQLMAIKALKKETSVNVDGKNILDEGNAKQIIDLFNTALNTVSYDKFPLNSESSVQGYICIYLKAAGAKVSAEVHSSKGRADLVIERLHRRIVIELNYADSDPLAKTKLNEAIEQIKNRDYGNVLPQKELIRIAAVYNANPHVRAIREYQQVE
ncbi:AAA family ATPase [Succinivibrio sp.]|uniref:AAA family ATPase n=1 Tax=Succinivibrio sp. TaxID=2053619 RepID=UPI0025872877|nr:AAA family ATPase [Succinivibrio sp.]MDD6205926.1 AAA family ATPase [Succinivibrio sp.]